MCCYSLSLRLVIIARVQTCSLCSAGLLYLSFGFIVFLSSGRYSKHYPSNAYLFAESILSYYVSWEVIIPATTGKIKCTSFPTKFNKVSIINFGQEVESWGCENVLCNIWEHAQGSVFTKALIVSLPEIQHRRHYKSHFINKLSQILFVRSLSAGHSHLLCFELVKNKS